MVYDMQAHLDDHMVWFWRELIVRALVPRHYYNKGVSHKETGQEIIQTICKHDRSSLVYDSIHGRSICIQSATSSYSAL